MSALRQILTSTAASPTANSDGPSLLSSLSDLRNLTPAYRRLRVDLAGQRLAPHVCPAELEDGSLVVLCTPEYGRSDLLAAIKEAVKRVQPVIDPRVVTITPTLLLTLEREHIDAGGLRARTDNTSTGRDRSAVRGAFTDIVRWALARGASDIHLNLALREVESQVSFTIMGRYLHPAHWRMPTARLQDIASVAWMDVSGGTGAVFDPRSEQQGRVYEVVDGVPVMLRWASLAVDAGVSVCLRLLRLDKTASDVTLESLGYLPSQVAMLRRAQNSEGGAIILSGVVGSGKSTTIARLLADLPDSRKPITLEDPVELGIPNALQATVSRSLAGGENPFGAKLRTVKRSAMTDLLVGEIRDQETALAWMDLVSSGTNVYTTVHVGGAALIPERLASDFLGVSRDLLATPGVLKLLVYQALLPRLCTCALPFSSLFKGGQGLDDRHYEGDHWRAYANRIGNLYQADTSALRVRNPEGCEHCRKPDLPSLHGFAGRTVVAEMIEPSSDLRMLGAIRQGDALRLMTLAASQRTATFDSPDMHGKTAMECAVYKALTGEIDPREVEPRFQAFETVERSRRQPS